MMHQIIFIYGYIRKYPYMEVQKVFKHENSDKYSLMRVIETLYLRYERGVRWKEDRLEYRENVKREYLRIFYNNDR